jgi:hypothetical protein
VGAGLGKTFTNDRPEAKFSYPTASQMTEMQFFVRSTLLTLRQKHDPAQPDAGRGMRRWDDKRDCLRYAVLLAFSRTMF